MDVNFHTNLSYGWGLVTHDQLQGTCKSLFSVKEVWKEGSQIVKNYVCFDLFHIGRVFCCLLWVTGALELVKKKSISYCHVMVCWSGHWSNPCFKKACIIVIAAAYFWGGIDTTHLQTCYGDLGNFHQNSVCVQFSKQDWHLFFWQSMFMLWLDG